MLEYLVRLELHGQGLLTAAKAWVCSSLSSFPADVLKVLLLGLTSVSDMNTMTPAASAIDAAKIPVWLLRMKTTTQAPKGAHRPASTTSPKAMPILALSVSILGWCCFVASLT
jgi:hypothetical protein